MTHDTATSTGLLTSTERETLVDPDTDEGTRNDILEHAADRLQETLTDFEVLYLTLRDSDLESVFCPDDEAELSAIRHSTQYALALLVLGMLCNDDMVEMRLADAIRYGAFSYGEEVTVDLDLRRGPLPSLEQCLDRFEREGLTEETFALFEHYLWESTDEIDRIGTACELLGLGPVTEEEAAEMRTELGFVERQPQSAITSVSVAESPAKDDDDD
jgi:hypothetical protein